MLRDIRSNYDRSSLSEDQVKRNPFDQFKLWLNEAIHEKVPEPTAMIVSTVDPEGWPDSRVVLLKEVWPDGFIFYTNYKSSKGKQIESNNHIAMNFFWPQLERQIRIIGETEKVPPQLSEEYFATRPVDSQLGAVASNQSSVISSRHELEDKYNELQKIYEGQAVPKPEHWGGYLVKPSRFEFWQGRLNRLHDRLRYEKSGNEWIIYRLSP
jgi:pyridoxamine 5'-phosphate oxidase